MAAEGPLLSLTGVSAYYGRVCALRDVNIAISGGETIAVLGANGAGKTTLLRSISGLMVRRTGRLVFEGTNIETEQSHRIVHLGISHVAEGRHLFPSLTVAENLEMGALIPHTSGRSAEVEDARARVLRLFPLLAERRDQLAGTLSGGEQQMLAIGRALMALPKLLLLDEPTVGLAPKPVEDLFATFHSLKSTGLTVMLAEQNVALALALADRAVVLRLGQIAVCGRAEDLRGRGDIQKIYLGSSE